MTNVLASCCCCNKLLKCSDQKRHTFVISRDVQAGRLLPEHLLSLGNRRTGHQPHLGYLLICPGSLSPSINSLVVVGQMSDSTHGIIKDWGFIFYNEAIFVTHEKCGKGRSALGYNSSPSLGIQKSQCKHFEKSVATNWLIF